MSDESIHNPHDQLFKEAFSRHETAVAFFESYLPAEIGSRLDWKSLQLQPGTYTDEALRGCESDLLYAVQIDQHPIMLVDLTHIDADALQGTLIGKAVLLALKASRYGLHHELPRILRLLAEVMQQDSRGN